MTSRNDDEWDNLFALAAGDSSSLETRNSLPKQQSSVSKEITTKRKKRKISTTKSDAFSRMLDSRMSSEVLITLQKCDGEIQAKDVWYISLYKIIWAIRRHALDNAIKRNDNMKQKNQPSNWDTCTNDILTFKHLRFPSSLDSGERVILEEKRNTLLKYVSIKRMTFQAWIRSIIACDNLYFRLYYLQIAGLLSCQEGVYLPHPVSYFNSFDDKSDGIDDTLIIMSQHKPNVMARFGLGESDDHPLAKLHHLRLRESHRLFSERLDPSETMQALAEPNLHPPTSLDYHNTVANPLLQEWRDSCRDDLCHLYSYATISKSNLQSMVTRLKELKVSKILELGAGTGYIAKLFQSFLPVTPYDVHPTTLSYNEYHGRTPPFVPVYHGTHETVNHLLGSSCALLLCYPPPQSTMAYDAVKSIWGNHARDTNKHNEDDKMTRVLIHIGEWKGLTGSKSLEHLLEQSGICIYRAPCWTWGTDAADVTIWCRKVITSVPNVVHSGVQLLSIPCVYCQKKHATRRCRLLRIAVYCSKTCWESDRQQDFSALCQLSLIPNDLPLEWDNKNHFMLL